MTNSSSNATGYGAFVFNSAYSLASPPIKGNYEIIARGGVTEGDNIVFSDGASTQTLDLGSGTNYITDVAPSIYAQGNGVYACDANFLDLENTPKALILVDRPDINNGTVPITKWVKGNPLINSPTIASTGANTEGAVTDHINASYSASDAGTASGQVTVFIDDSGEGNWGLADTAETLNNLLYKRRDEYGSLQSQLDKLWHDIDDDKLDKNGAWYKAVKAVKDANPKE